MFFIETHAQAVQAYNDALRMGTVRQIRPRSMTNPVPSALSLANEGKNVMIEKPSPGKNVIIVMLGVLVLLLWSRLSTCCSCNWD
jgi:hypothetical protein